MKVVQGIKTGFLFVLGAGLTACGPSPQPQAYVQQPAPQVQYAPAPQQQYAPAQQPVVVQQHDGIGTGTALVGAAAIGTAAYLAGKNAGSNKPSAPTYTQPPSISQPAPAAPVITPPAAKPATPAPVAQAAPAQKAFVPTAAANTATVKEMRAPAPTTSFKPTAVAAKRK